MNDEMMFGSDVKSPADVARSSVTLDRLIGQALVRAADRWDGVAVLIGEAMGIALLMSAQNPCNEPVDLPDLADLADLDLAECINRALREIQRWDLMLASDHPDMTRLRVVLADVRRDLVAESKRRG
jgi:hypothetical protein